MSLFKKVLIFCFIISLFSSSISRAKAQIYKSIDKFESNKYYHSFTYVTGMLNDSIVSNQGLRINYHFNGMINSSFTLPEGTPGVPPLPELPMQEPAVNVTDKLSP